MSKMLSSWKEIAHFFGKGVRTVQRWEKTLDLPIHRPAGAPSNVVLARTSDLEEWMHRGPVTRAVSTEEPDNSATLPVFAELAKLEDEVFSLADWAEVKHGSADITLSAETRLSTLSAVLFSINEKFGRDRTARAA